MVFHPRQGGSRRRGGGWPWGRPVSRREFLRLSGSAAAAAALVACGGGTTTGSGGTRVLIGTPEDPVTQPIFDDNPPIDSDLEPEAGPLRLYNWEDYIWPRVLKDFTSQTGVEVELSTFYNLEEALRKIRTGEVQFDVFFPTAENIPKLVAGKVLQPLNHDYLPNLSNIWPRLQDPYYDQGSLYTIPYAVYQTGIGWRADMADLDLESMANPWDVFWDPAHRDITGMYDDYRETIGIALYHVGSNDINTGDPNLVNQARDALIEASNDLNLAFTVDGAYIGLPEGRFGLHHAWSGDVAAAPYYAPKGQDPSTLRYAWPPKLEGSTAGGYISNDSLGIFKDAQSPVLAHMFLNFMMDFDVALKNFSWVLYQPPQSDLDPDSLVEDEYISPNVASTVIRQEDFELGQKPIQLSPEKDRRWLQAWSEVQAGG